MGYKEDFDAGYNALDGEKAPHGGGKAPKVSKVASVSLAGCVIYVLLMIFLVIFCGFFIKGCMPDMMDATKSRILQSSENL